MALSLNLADIVLLEIPFLEAARSCSGIAFDIRVKRRHENGRAMEHTLFYPGVGISR